jgi:hypothetical protein
MLRGARIGPIRYVASTLRGWVVAPYRTTSFDETQTTRRATSRRSRA